MTPRMGGATVARMRECGRQLRFVGDVRASESRAPSASILAHASSSRIRSATDQREMASAVFGHPPGDDQAESTETAGHDVAGVGVESRSSGWRRRRALESRSHSFAADPPHLVPPSAASSAAIT